MIIIISHASLDELELTARSQALTAQREIARLIEGPLEPGERQIDRAMRIAAHANDLAQAWVVIDAIEHEELTVSPPPTSSEPQGCVPEDLN